MSQATLADPGPAAGLQEPVTKGKIDQGTGEAHTLQLVSHQWHPGADGELLMEGASFVLIRTSFQLPSAQALEPLTGQPHLPPHQLAT